MFSSNKNLGSIYLDKTVKAIGSNLNLLDDCLEYNQLVSDLIEDSVVLNMQDYIQHGNTTCYQHCINVSYYSYKLGKRLGLDTRSIARAALLHDLFLYDWHKVMIVQPLLKKHGFTHPKKALENATEHFELNEKEQDIIVKHMWPLTLRLPKYKESYIVVLMDKYCCLLETFYPIFHKMPFLKSHATYL